MRSFNKALIVFVATLLGGLAILPSLRKAPPLPVLGQVPGFTLTDSRAETFSSATLSGKIWVADFIFTTCGGPCPEMSSQLATLHRAYLLDGRVRMVSVTVNPEYDSPQVLSAYAAKYKADESRWHFLTGPLDSIHALSVQGFKLGSVENPVNHSAKFVLVDGLGRIRGYYTGTEKEEVRQLFRDMARLLKEDRG